MNIFYWILGASFVVSLISLVGRSIVFLGEEKFRRFMQFSISVAVGVMLGVVFLDLLPEALEMGSEEAIFLWLLTGFLFFFVLERLFLIYHCHDGECSVHSYGYLSLFGDGIHNFIDGVIIALAFMVNVPLGIATGFAVLFHEIPQEMSDFMVLLNAGFKRGKALFYNFLLALTAVAGALITYFLGDFIRPFIGPALAVAAGNFLYIAAVDLVPELHHAEHHGKKRFAFLHALFISFGILLMYLVGEFLH